MSIQRLLLLAGILAMAACVSPIGPISPTDFEDEQTVSSGGPRTAPHSTLSKALTNATSARGTPGWGPD